PPTPPRSLAPPPPAVPKGTPPGTTPPGLTLESHRLINYLPGIYHTDFMARFLGIFEAILTPIEWNIDNFDLYLNPATAPRDFIPWLASWFDIAFDPSWTEAQQRRLLKEAATIYARRGTRWALSRVLEIYTGETPTIDDTGSDLEPFTFKVILPAATARLEREMIERLIDIHKPAHTLYTLEFQP
ncbi:MAG: phage tail protein I, partial [Anaerolineae bacterium]|nr:phage tail protein I [Anaerolineae bacterium]